MKNWQAYLLALISGILLSGVILLVSQPPRGRSLTLTSPQDLSTLSVHITGAVSQPGVYSLPFGSRVVDAVQAAGGMTDDANQDFVNLAARVTDGEKITIPFSSESFSPESRLPDLPSTPTKSPSEIVYPINLNTATISDLESLPGIGSLKAEQIVLYRQEHGPFTSIEEIMNVPGIASLTFEKLKDLIYVK